VTLLTFQTQAAGDTAVIALEGELDVAGSALLEAEIDRVLAEHGSTKIVLDLSGLDFMDSTGLRLVVLSDAKAREGGWQLLLVRGNESVHRVFEITRMAERLNFTDPEAA
jgi:anti-sigma B factor antagonist